MPGRKNNKKPKADDVSKDLLDLIHQTFPDDVVEMTVTEDESCLAELYPKLQARLRRISAAELVYERAPDPEPAWADDDDEFEDPPLDVGLSASYHLFFLALRGQEFCYKAKGDSEDEEGQPLEVDGEGRIGFALAVCALTPLAVIRFTTMEQYEDGSSTLPDIWDNVFSMDGQPIDPEQHIQEAFGVEAVQALTQLRNRLVKVLDTLAIRLLLPVERSKPVPWLKAGEEAFVGDAFSGRPLTVQEAFFFQRP